MKKETYLIVGASGLVGSEIAKLLKSKGLQVKRATSQKKMEPDQVYLNLVTGEGLKAAFEGIDRAFFLSPPGYADQKSMLSPLIQEAKRRGLSKVVLMTAMGANAVETTPFRQAEIELEKSGLAYNIIRPNWFMQNFNSYWIQGILQQGKILVPAGKGQTSFIDARDIAEVAAELLVSDKYNNKDFDLTGLEALDHDQVAKAISTSTGKSIVYEEISPEDFKKTFLQAGLPEGYVDFLVLIFGYLKNGYNSGINQNVKEITGRNPRSFQDYVRDYKKSWI